MHQLTSTSPSDIANAARCFESCIPGTLQSALRLYLLAQLANIATPPCITPTAPVSSAGAKSIGPTSFRIVWSQPSNTGSLITSYTIKWGTVSGMYTNTVTVPVVPKVYDLTELTSGTQYFWVVVANSSAAVGCSSVNSNEGNATTTGSPPSNHLLQNLISYWKFDVDSSPYADSVGSNPLTGTLTNAAVAGIINNGLSVLVGTSHADHVSNTDFMPGAGISLSLSAWISSSDWTTGGTGPFPNFINKGDNATLNSYDIGQIAASRILYANCEDSSTFVASINLTAGAPTANVFHHVVISFDATNKVFTAYFDGVLKGTVGTVTNQLANGAQTFYVGPNNPNASWPNLTIDEMALWHKALTQADVTNIFNGGSCLPLSGYQT